MTATGPEHAPAARFSRQSRLIRLSAVATSFLLAGFATVTTSRAAFTTTTSNTASTASTASLALTDDDSASAMFTLTGMVPGQPNTKCVAVTYTGNLSPQPAEVQVYRSAAVTGTGLDQYIDMTIERGTGGTFTDCTGFSGTAIYTGTMQAFMNSRTSWASGLGTGWTPSATPQTRVFRVTLTLQNDNAAQGKDVGFGFTWETQL